MSPGPSPATDAGALLHGAAEAMGLPITPRQVAQLVEYVSLLERWNRTYNLTAIRGLDRIVSHHIADSLAVVNPLRRRLGEAAKPALVDVGSGAGLPGLVLAVMNPDWRITCVDAVGKKAAFMRQAVSAIGLSNTDVRHQRVEQMRDDRYELVVSRAFTGLAEMVALTEHLLVDGGAWAAMKGQIQHNELADLDSLHYMFHVEQLSVPGLNAERCIVWIQRK